MIYFIQCGKNGPVKIGTAVHVKSRLSSMQTGTPIQLKLLAVETGAYWREKELHTKFAECRLRGEWFHPDARLLVYIAQLSPIEGAENRRSKMSRARRKLGDGLSVCYNRTRKKWIGRKSLGRRLDGSLVVAERWGDTRAEALQRLEEVGESAQSFVQESAAAQLDASIPDTWT